MEADAFAANFDDSLYDVTVVDEINLMIFI